MPAAQSQPVESSSASDVLLEVRNLHVSFAVEGAVARAVEGVDLCIHRGETLGLVGESGCGKSVTSQAILRLLPEPPARVTADALSFEGRDLLSLSAGQMRHVRGAGIAMVFQEAATSLNPVYTIGTQIAEAIRAHGHVSRSEARRQAVELLGRVRIPSPGQRIDDYPHQLSGGMRQRAMIAVALAANPTLLIADEPTTALDVTIQAQVLDLFGRIKAESDMALLLVTHDLGIVSHVADRVAVMYSGRIVETAPVDALFAGPLHPYTRGLLECVPRLDQRHETLPVIPGTVPDPARKPPGCPFHPRCSLAREECRREMPPAIGKAPGRTVACWAC